MTTLRNRFHVFVACMTMAVVAGCDDADPADLPAEDVVYGGCTSHDDCVGGRCIQGIVEGLCTTNCSTQDACPDGTVCTDTEASRGVCLFRCTSAQECRDWLGAGYTCDEETDLTTGEDVRVCIDA